MLCLLGCVFVWWRGSAPLNGAELRHHTTNKSSSGLLSHCFLINNDLQMRGHVLMQLDRDDEFAHGLQRFV